MLESKIEKDVCNYAKAKGWLVYKFSSPAQRGVPDRILFKSGVIFFIEFKAPGKKPTKYQQKTIEKFRKQKIDVFVIDNIEDGKKCIDEKENKFKNM